MKQTFLLSATTLLLFVLSACSKGSSTNNNNNGNTPPGPLFTSVKALMQTSCATPGCHAGASPASGLNFTVDNTIVVQKDRIKVRAVDQAGTANQMPQPPNPPLSATDRKKITDWVAAGGKLTD